MFSRNEKGGPMWTAARQTKNLNLQITNAVTGDDPPRPYCRTGPGLKINRLESP